MAIMGLWCLCAYTCTLLTLTPLSLPPQSYQAILLQTFHLSCNTFFTTRGEIEHSCQAIVLRSVIPTQYLCFLKPVMLVPPHEELPVT